MCRFTILEEFHKRNACDLEMWLLKSFDFNTIVVATDEHVLTCGVRVFVITTDAT